MKVSLPSLAKMDNCQLQFLLKCMLGAFFTLHIVSVNSSPILSHDETPAEASSSIANLQYKFNNRESTFQPMVQNQNQQHRQPFTVPQQGQQEDIYKTYNPNFVTNFQQLTPNGAEILNIRPSRRTIMSTLMAPLISMREQAMNMLGATFQGCGSPGSSSLFCRILRMFNVV
jgi:hypothetical protein